MGQGFDRRGARTDEMLKLFRALWQPGWTEFEGEFYRTPKLEMEPKPPSIPILVGGETQPALRRAASNDGWVAASALPATTRSKLLGTCGSYEPNRDCRWTGSQY